MSYIDKALRLCTRADFYGAAGSAYIGDSIDLGPSVHSKLFGGPMPMVLVVRVTGAMVAGTSVLFTLRTGSAVSGGNLSAGQAAILASQAVPTASMVRGATLIQALPYASWISYLRYMQMQVTRVGTSTGGRIDAYLSPMEEAWEAVRSERPLII